ncbi:serine/threonine protein phosphatase [Nonomuraea coxensis]|uniref:serine/threonine protein phosphatase n=1 Tax=Nonomuraea coxensis TaxID=404386 RepID=UPI0012FA0C21|nr:serine/threonine protein phosphatase [Nonomuraea coxensis]
MKVCGAGLPDPSGTGVVWHYMAPRVLAIGVWTERCEGRGEDAEPLFTHRMPDGEGILGVFDGLGGAGAGASCELSDGTRRSGAWIGARLVRAGVEAWFRSQGPDPDPGGTPESLRGHLAELLSSVPAPPPSKIVSRMRKWLPTTMAVLRYRLDGEAAECRALWAGDSRVYALSRESGLQALTRDHTEETDCLRQLTQDPPMTNLICAGQEFVIDSHTLRLPLPCVLVCATDGFFGYVGTPAHFECHLLSTLQEARDEQEWAELLARLVSSYTGDDASLSLAALGFADFAQLRSGFIRRAREAEARYRPADLPAEDLTASEWRLRAWDEYRPAYERLMPPARPAKEPA